MFEHELELDKDFLKYILIFTNRFQLHIAKDNQSSQKFNNREYKFVIPL